jgi:hypothetical protein
MDYKQKYLKYKHKYLELKNKLGGAVSENIQKIIEYNNKFKEYLLADLNILFKSNKYFTNTLNDRISLHLKTKIEENKDKPYQYNRYTIYLKLYNEYMNFVFDAKSYNTKLLKLHEYLISLKNLLTLDINKIEYKSVNYMNILNELVLFIEQEIKL